MKSFIVSIEGVADLLQHRFGMSATQDLANASKEVSNGKDYSGEWFDSLYVDHQSGKIYQPAIQLERAMIAASSEFKIQGRRGKTYKEVFTGSIFVKPDYVFHEGITLEDFQKAAKNSGSSERVRIDCQPVRVQRARVLRYRPAIRAGWKLSFTVESLDDDLRLQVLKSVLDTAGAKKGIGDYRPRYGRFVVTKIEETK